MGSSKSGIEYLIVPFDPKHLSLLKGRKDKELETAYQRGPAFTGFCDGEIFGIGGVSILWPGLGEAWVLFGKNFKQHKIFIHRETLRHLKWIAAKHKLKRIQAAAEKENQMACRWLKSLGFSYEGDMPEFWQGKTFSRYARLFKCSE